MIDRGARWVADAAGARLAAGAAGDGGPARAVIDTREVRPGDLFVGLPGASADGGEFAGQAVEAGAWGVLVAEHFAEEAARAASPAPAGSAPSGSAPTVLAADDPLAALQRLARAWRDELGAPVVAVTGSTGKTSTKDILAAMLSTTLGTVHATRENLNTEIGVPLTLLEAQRGTEAIVLELAMRGEGQIAELVEIARPDVGVIVNVGPVHLELLGTVERVAAAKAELIRGLEPGATCVVPAAEPLLDAHLRADLDTIAFGPGGDVALLSLEPLGGERSRAEIELRGEIVHLELGFSAPHNLLNALAALGAADAVGARPQGRIDPRFSSLRGQVLELAGGVTVVNDCYNANPMSMRAALQHLAESPAERRVAVLGRMAELGAGERGFHEEVGDQADRLGIDVLVAVGEDASAYAERFGGETYAVATPEEAGALLGDLARAGDRVLVKGSRSVGLERVLA